MDVFLTVDTEIWPFFAGWPVTALPPGKDDFSGEIRGYIHGDTPAGAHGLPLQLGILAEHGLKATYFVEALFAEKAGLAPLREIVDLVRSAGQEVQLHLHTEWLREARDPSLPSPFRQHIRQFSEDDQVAIVARGIANLEACGADGVCAFRAGNYGASNATLRALRRAGLRFDTSLNACYLDAACDIRTPAPVIQPTEIEGIVEYPVAVFADFPGHRRHAQLCACSAGELTGAIEAAAEAGWSAFTIVLHGFELVRNVRDPARRAPDPINVGRFRRLCAFLAENRQRYRTRFFAELDRAAPPAAAAPPIRSPIHRTLWRYAEQAASRLL